jgi:hypothetical protein
MGWSARRRFGRRALGSALRSAPLATLLLSGNLGCYEITLLPENAEYFDPPASYQLWWDQTVACSGVSRSLQAVDFFVVPGAAAFPVNSSDAVGVYHEYRDRIILAGEFQFHGPTVRHEMLHALIKGRGGHPREYFLHRCGGVVGCGLEGCIQDAGPLFPLPEGTVAIAAESLLVSSAVYPGAPSRSTTGDWIGYVITVTNPKPYPVLVIFADAAQPGGARPFRYRVDHALGSISYGSYIEDDGLRFFRAGESKRAMFDFAITGSGFNDVLPLGNNTFSGGFGGTSVPPIAVMIVP